MKWLFLAVLMLFCAREAQAVWYWPFGGKDIDYTVVFNGIDDEVRGGLVALKLDKPESDQPVANPDDLQRELAVRGDRVRRGLESLGFYDAFVAQSVSGTAVLVYDIRPGPRAYVAAIQGADEGHVKVGEPVNAQAILDDAQALLARLEKDSCALYLRVDSRVKLYDKPYRGGRRAEVEFVVERGAESVFGPVSISGTHSLDDAVVMRRIGWKEGDCFKARKVEASREDLLASQLFSAVSLDYPTDVSATRVSGTSLVPVNVVLSERVPRTLRAGASYGTDEGFMLTSGWEHRNLWGGAEKLEVATRIGQMEQGLNGKLTLPAYGAPRQDFVLSGGYRREDTDAYEAETWEGAAGVERPLWWGWRGGIGGGYRYSVTQDSAGVENTYGLLSAPAFLAYDSRRNTLNPKRGVVARVDATPYAETFGDGGRFLKIRGEAQTYLSANLPLSPTLALRGAAGAIYGAKGADVPSDIRFYAGGGGSVRGYGYQTLGPRSGTSAVGGSSMITASGELRLRFTDDYGGVAFVDAGNVFDQSAPQQLEKLYMGAGVGVRYFTAIGPIRLDVAVPMNGKDIGAEGYAMYVSIGQSF